MYRICRIATLFAVMGNWLPVPDRGMSRALAAVTTVFSQDFSAGVGDLYLVDSDIASLTLESGSPLLGSGPELRLESTSTALSAIVGYYSPVTLVNPGDSIRFTFDAYNFNGGFIDSGFRFGLFNSNGTRISSNGNFDFLLDSLDDDGLYAFVDVGSSTINNSAFLRENDNNTEARLFGGRTFANADNGGLSDPLMFSENTATSYGLDLTLQSDSNLDVLLFSDDSGEVPGAEGALFATVLTPPTLTFDTFYLGGNGDSNSVIDYRFDNLEIASTAVPEPNTLAMAMLATGIALVGRRRKLRSRSDRFS